MEPRKMVDISEDVRQEATILAILLRENNLNMDKRVARSQFM